MGHLEGNFTPVLYMGRKVPLKVNKPTWETEDVYCWTWACSNSYFAHDTTIFRNPHNSSNWDSGILHSWTTNTPSVKILCPQKHCFSLYFRKNVTCLNVVLLMIISIFFISCKAVYKWVMTNGCSMNDLLRGW
jgi:hypothetical protein